MQKFAAGTLDKDPDEKEEGSHLNEKTIATYKKLGVIMKTYKSGKLPKAFMLIPYTNDWEDLLFLTEPQRWSPNATYEATRLFASNLNEKMAQRFYSIVLLDNVRDNIAKYKKLSCHLYRAVKKAMFKISAFFKGFLLPLAEDATAREAVIIGSILAKMSINNLDAAAVMMKLSMMPYGVGSGFFLKTLLAKKFALPTQVINSIIKFFLNFAVDAENLDGDDIDSEMDMDEEGGEGPGDDDEENATGLDKDKDLPVMWH